MTTEAFVTSLKAPDYPDDFHIDKEEMVDGVWVVAPLKKFADIIRRQAAFRGVKFGTIMKRNTSRHHELQVYFPDDIYTMGTIGYRDDKYFVMRSSIRNKKYAAWNANFRRVYSGNLDRAKSNAKRHLRRYSAADVAKHTVDDAAVEFYRRWSDYNDKREKAVRKIANDIGSSTGSITNELFALQRAGHTWIDPEVGNMVQDMMDALDEINKVGADLNHVTLVFTLPPIGNGPSRVQLVSGPEVGITHETDDKLRDIFCNEAWVQDHTQVLEIHEVPEDISGRIAVLNMVEDEHFVEGVGYRASARVMYVLH